MKKKLNYFLGDTYSKDIFPFFKDVFGKSLDVKPIDSNSDIPQEEFVIISPTVSGTELQFKDHKNLIIMLDFCHCDFNDIEKYLSQFDPILILTPQAVQNKRVILGSMSLLKTRVEVTDRPKDNETIFFCSQPLKEDNRGIDQNELIHSISKITHKKIVVKRHPREKNHPLQVGISEYAGTINEALTEFKNWIGFNSMALYSARALDSNVFMIKNEYPNYRESLTNFLNDFKSNLEVNNASGEVPLLLEEFRKFLS